MKYINLGNVGLKAPVIAVGCMRMSGLSIKNAESFIKTALELGACFFDHADIYGGGTSEEIFSKAASLNESMRENVIIQSKCGIASGKFDSSREHIISSAEGILRRLNTDYLDILLLHRPDALVEPEEVAEAFNYLYETGKVRHFGVSNHNPMQIELLRKYINRPIVANQMQLSVMCANMISNGINVNMTTDSAIMRDGSVLDYCRLNDITIQPWSPFQYGFFEGVFLGNEKFPALNAKINEIATKYEVSDTTIVIAWLLRHPAKMQPVVGTMNENRLKDIVKACEITLTREEWYGIYLAAGNILP